MVSAGRGSLDGGAHQEQAIWQPSTTGWLPDVGASGPLWLYAKALKSQNML
jgi:hypothetical protein